MEEVDLAKEGKKSRSDKIIKKICRKTMVKYVR